MSPTPIRFTVDDIFRLAGIWAVSPHDFMRDAADAIARNHFQPILGRNDDALYLLRCWVTAPQPGEDGKFDSADSTLLHWFPRGDDDESLHDHPWDFTTTILAGGYIEHLPQVGWMDQSNPPDQLVGPLWNAHTIGRFPGTRVQHAAEDLHCVGRLLQPGTYNGPGGGCWTRVKTGPRRRDWGFHPPGQQWQPWRSYIASRQPALAATSP